jgi:small subunit ribosomal protein S15
MLMSKTFQLFCQRNAVNSSLALARNYAFKSDLKIKWVGPERIKCIDPRKSGDLDKYEKPEGSRLMYNYEKSEELKQADEMIKEMFTLDKNKRSESVLIYKSEMIDKVRRHGSDYGSVEVKSKLKKTVIIMQLVLNCPLF